MITEFNFWKKISVDVDVRGREEELVKLIHHNVKEIKKYKVPPQDPMSPGLTEQYEEYFIELNTYFKIITNKFSNKPKK